MHLDFFGSSCKDFCKDGDKGQRRGYSVAEYPTMWDKYCQGAWEPVSIPGGGLAWKTWWKGEAELSVTLL